MRSFKILSAIAAALPLASAYPVISTPAAGASLTSTTVVVTWTDSGTPALTAMGAFTIDLYGGSNTAATLLSSGVASGTSVSTTSTVTATIDTSVGGDVTNAYYLKMTTQVTGGGEIITFSPRFSIEDMTGSFDTTFTVTNSAASAEISTTGTVTVASSTTLTSTGSYVETGSYAITYTLQTGGTRYAPMPLRPGSTITATHTSPQYPTSSVSIATTYLGTPNCILTSTDAVNYSVESHANTAAAASQPTGDAAKFLARWKD